MGKYLVIPHYYHKSINFGDCISPYILEKLTGRKCVFTEQTPDITTIMCTGSILGTNVSNSVIWGNGFAWKYSDIEIVTKPLKICAVRGKLTRDKFLENGIDCPEIYGDPALILPKLYQPKDTSKRYKLGIIPHIINYDEACEKLKYKSDEITVIDLKISETNSIEDVIDKIVQCEKTISSSLHGIIVSNAYNIDCLWVHFSAPLQGDGFKFWDYFSCTDIEPYLSINPFEKIANINQIISEIPPCKITIDIDSLIKSCPVL